MFKFKRLKTRFKVDITNIQIVVSWLCPSISANCIYKSLRWHFSHWAENLRCVYVGEKLQQTAFHKIISDSWTTKRLDVVVQIFLGDEYMQYSIVFAWWICSTNACDYFGHCCFLRVYVWEDSGELCGEPHWPYAGGPRLLQRWLHVIFDIEKNKQKPGRESLDDIFILVNVTLVSIYERTAWKRKRPGFLWLFRLWLDFFSLELHFQKRSKEPWAPYFLCNPIANTIRLNRISLNCKQTQWLWQWFKALRWMLSKAPSLLNFPEVFAGDYAGRFHCSICCHRLDPRIYWNHPGLPSWRKSPNRVPYTLLNTDVDVKIEKDEKGMYRPHT